MAVDELGVSALPPADEYVFGGVKLPASVRGRTKALRRSAWSWRYIRYLGCGEFAWWFVIVVPLTSCTVLFWVAANKNLEQLGQGPLILHESWGIWKHR